MPYPNEMYTMASYNRLVSDELKYDKDGLRKEHHRLYTTLTSEQKGIYKTIIDAVTGEKGGMFFVYGYGGTGKTYLYKTLSSALRSKGEIVLNVASSGIAALLLEGRRTAHSRFAIPINVVDDSMYHILADSDLAELIRMSKLIIWDEAPMTHRHCCEAFDRTLRDICRTDPSTPFEKVFGGKVVLFGGDFRQILPVVTNGSRQDVVHASINSSYLWKHCKVMRLTVNMRLGTGSNNSERKEIQDFADWILSIGNRDEHGTILVPYRHRFRGTTSRDLWLSLKKAYTPHSTSREYTLKTQLLRIKMHDDKTPDAYLNRAQEYADALAAIGEPVKDKDLVMLVVSGLREEYNGLKTAITAPFYGARPSNNNKSNNNNNRGNRNNSRGNNNRGHDNGRQFDWASTQNTVYGTCNRCGIGHIPSQCLNHDPSTICTRPSTNFANTRAQSSNASANWHSDTGANSHVTPDLEAMDNSEAYYGDDALHVSNGKGLLILHIGSSKVYSPQKTFSLKKHSSCTRNLP
ncbi:ATP-dependent DNA helicase PIF1-like protein [Tanacetum coccineum]